VTNSWLYKLCVIDYMRNAKTAMLSIGLVKWRVQVSMYENSDLSFIENERYNSSSLSSIQRVNFVAVQYRKTD